MNTTPDIISTQYRNYSKPVQDTVPPTHTHFSQLKQENDTSLCKHIWQLKLKYPV